MNSDILELQQHFQVTYDTRASCRLFCRDPEDRLCFFVVVVVIVVEGEASDTTVNDIFLKDLFIIIYLFILFIFGYVGS